MMKNDFKSENDKNQNFLIIKTNYLHRLHIIITISSFLGFKVKTVHVASYVLWKKMREKKS